MGKGRKKTQNGTRGSYTIQLASLHRQQLMGVHTQDRWEAGYVQRLQKRRNGLTIRWALLEAFARGTQTLPRTHAHQKRHREEGSGQEVTSLHPPLYSNRGWSHRRGQGPGISAVCLWQTPGRWNQIPSSLSSFSVFGLRGLLETVGRTRKAFFSSKKETGLQSGVIMCSGEVGEKEETE